MTQADGAVSTSGAPKSYPSIYWGCHYADCTTGFSPVQASSGTFGSVRTSVAMTYPTSGEWDASYDLWFDPTPRTDGQNTGAEVMVWLNHAGRPQPVGSKVGTVTLAGATWDVWYGNTGWNVVSYVRQTPTSSADFAVSTFFDDALARGWVQRSWYLTSIQAGFEPWTGGAGLAVTSFSAGTGSTGTPTAPPPARPPRHRHREPHRDGDPLAATDVRASRLLRDGEDRVRLGRRGRAERHGHQRRRGPHGLDHRRDAARRSDGDQPVERHLDAVRADADGEERLLQRLPRRGWDDELRLPARRDRQHLDAGHDHLLLRAADAHEAKTTTLSR